MNDQRRAFRRFLAVLFCGFCLGSIVQRGQANETTKQPNVVIFLVDDMGIMDTSVPFLTDSSGNPKRYPLNEYYRTPGMERLAANGIRFNQFCAMSVCSPSRVSIETGQYSARHHTTNWVNARMNNAGDNGPPEWDWNGLGIEDVTLARILQNHGYQTIHIGKAHFGSTEAAGPHNLGFDVNVAGISIGHPASYFSEDHYGNKLSNSKNKQQPHPNAVPGLDKYHDSGLFLTEALTLEAKDKVSAAVQNGKPFFLNFSHYAVHTPFQTDPRFAENYPEDSRYPQSRSFATLIEGMDKSLGDILDHLQSLGVAEETLVLFLGDNGSDAPRKNEHGISSSAPLRGKKGTHYEGGTRIPFIAAWAKPNPENPLQKSLPIAAGAIQPQLGSICDIYPTVLDVCRIDDVPEHRVDGSSLRVLLTGAPDSSRPETFLMHYPHDHRSKYFTSYRDGTWKVIYHYLPTELSNGQHYQLFNLENDPYEQTDLAATHPQELRRMMIKLDEALKDCQALYPVQNGQELHPQIP